MGAGDWSHLLYLSLCGRMRMVIASSFDCAAILAQCRVSTDV